MLQQKKLWSLKYPLLRSKDKPFKEFIEQHFTPALQEAFTAEGLEDMKLQFTKQGLPIHGADPQEQCWQIIGNWQNGQRQFNLYFLEEDISGSKAFSAGGFAGGLGCVSSAIFSKNLFKVRSLFMIEIFKSNRYRF